MDLADPASGQEAELAKIVAFLLSDDHRPIEAAAFIAGYAPRIDALTTHLVSNGVRAIHAATCRIKFEVVQQMRDATIVARFNAVMGGLLRNLARAELESHFVHEEGRTVVNPAGFQDFLGLKMRHVDKAQVLRDLELTSLAAHALEHPEMYGLDDGQYVELYKVLAALSRIDESAWDATPLVRS